MKESRCRSCGAKILWVKTFSGKAMPVDAGGECFYPDDKGKDLFVTLDGAVVHGIKADRQAKHTHKGYISHFATCPNADAHRKKGGSHERK